MGTKIISVIILALLASAPPVKKQFSLLVRVPESYSTDQVKTAGVKWKAVIEKWKDEGVYVLSFAFQGESFTVSGKEMTVKKESVLSENLRVVSNVVLETDSMETALELAKQSPVLEFGGSVEVREIPGKVQQ